MNTVVCVLAGLLFGASVFEDQRDSADEQTAEHHQESDRNRGAHLASESVLELLTASRPSEYLLLAEELHEVEPDREDGLIERLLVLAAAHTPDSVECSSSLLLLAERTGSPVDAAWIRRIALGSQEESWSVDAEPGSGVLSEARGDLPVDLERHDCGGTGWIESSAGGSVVRCPECEARGLLILDESRWSLRVRAVYERIREAAPSPVAEIKLGLIEPVRPATLPALARSLGIDSDATVFRDGQWIRPGDRIAE